MTMLADRVDAVIGVDTHKRTHTAALVTPTGGLIEHRTAPSDGRGIERLLAFAQRQAPGRRVWAIEGTGSYGAGLTSALLERGEWVVEIDRPKRRRRDGAKSDELDALRAAREALGRDHLAGPRRRGDREALRVLLCTREAAVRTRTRSIAALHALVVCAPEAIRCRLRGLRTKALVRHCARLRPGVGRSTEQRATLTAMRSTARRVLACEAEAAELASALAAIVVTLRPDLLTEPGMGSLSAARILNAWSHPGRIRSEAAFAMLAGVAPIEASSGQKVRHRLDRAGDRQLNRALHTIVMSRLRCDAETQAYAARRTAEGKTPREIRRCLKRYVARRIFRLLEDPARVT